MIDYLRTLLLFYRRHLRTQPLRELMAVAGVAVGVALLFAVQVAHRSITGSFEEITRGVAGRATIELAARGPGGFDERIAQATEAMPDVKVTAPVLEQPVVAVGPQGRRALTLVGTTEAVASLAGELGVQFLRAGEAARRGALVLTESTARAIGARTGDVLAIQLAGRTEHLVLAATVPSAKIGALAESPVAAAPLPIVQSIAGLPGRVTRVVIEPRAGREAALRRLLAARFGATLNVRSIDTEARLLGNAAGPEKQITLLFSAISLVAGVILAYNALLLAGEERRRFIVYLIQTGTPDSMIVASLAFDALILGIAGSLLGLLAGDLVSLAAFRSVPGYIAAAFPVGGQRVVGVPTILIAFAGGMLAAFAAAVLPALAALRGGAAAEPDAVGPTLTVAHRLRLSSTTAFACGAALVCLSVLLAALLPATTVVALVALVAGLVVCLPTILHQLLRLARAVSRRSGDPAGRLAVAELRGSPNRSVALLATGTVAAFLMIVIGGSVANVEHAARKGATDLLSSGNVWIRPGGPENIYATQPFAYTDIQHRLQHLGIVSSVLPWRDSFLDLPSRRVWVLGVPPQATAQIAPTQLIEGSLLSADMHIREGGWAAVSQTIAREDRLHIGQLFTIPTPTGHARLRLAATIANYGWLSGAIVMNGDEHARLWSSNAATQLSVTLRPGVPSEQGRRAIEATLPIGSAFTVKTAQKGQAEVSKVLGSALSRLNETTIIVLLATIASVIALTIAAIWQRRDRIESLISIGMSAGQLARLVFYETGSVLLCGCLLGMAAGLAGQALIDGWLHQTTGSPVVFAPAWQLGLRTVLIVAGISIAASMIAVVQSNRFQPRTAFSLE
jgi:putative ABC transport system permease protein